MMRILLICLLVFTAGMSQSTLRKIKDKIKEESRAIDRQVEIRTQQLNVTNRADTTSNAVGHFYPYQFLDDDEIPINAVITIYDGRFTEIPSLIDTIFDTNRKRPEQFYGDYPGKSDEFIDPYQGRPSFYHVRYTYGYDSTDSLVNQNLDLLAAYQKMTISIKYTSLKLVADDPIEFTFFYISPGVLWPLSNNDSFVQIHAGLGRFAVDASDFERSFGGLNLGTYLKYHFDSGLTSGLKLDYLMVEHDKSVNEYFMSILLTDIHLGWLTQRWEWNIGYTLQTFRDIGLTNDTETTQQFYVGAAVFF